MTIVASSAREGAVIHVEVEDRTASGMGSSGTFRGTISGGGGRDYEGPTRGGEGMGRGALPAGTGDAFQAGMALIRQCAEQVAATLSEVGRTIAPDEVEVQFGIKMDLEVGAFICKSKSEAQLQVTLKWAKGPG